MPRPRRIKRDNEAECMWRWRYTEDKWVSQRLFLEKKRKWRIMQYNKLSVRKNRTTWEVWYRCHERLFWETWEVLFALINKLWFDAKHTTVDTLFRYLLWEIWAKTLHKERDVLYPLLNNESNWLPKEEV